jgi:hypothetical protein
VSPRIMEDCVGSKSGVKVTHRALTAIRVATAQGSVTGSSRSTHLRTGHRPVNQFVGSQFVGKAGQSGRR